MGRYKKYITEKDRRQARQRWNQDYYVRNKEIIDKKAKERYHRKMGKKVSVV